MNKRKKMKNIYLLDDAQSKQKEKTKKENKKRSEDWEESLILEMKIEKT